MPGERESDGTEGAGVREELPDHFYVRLLSALYFSTFCIRASFGMFIVAFPDYLDAPQFRLGILWAASPLFELLSALWIGAIIDRFGRKKVLIAGLVLGALSLATLPLTRSHLLIFVINGFHGVSAGCIIVSSLALLADYVKPEVRGRAIGVFDGVNIFGWATGFFVGGVLMHAFEPDIGMVFVAAAGFALLGAAYAWFNISEPHTESNLVKRMSLSHIAEVLQQRSFLYLVLTWFVVYVLIGSLLAYAEPMASSMGLSSLQTGAIMGGVCVAILAAQLFFGWMSDIVGRTRIMVVGVVGIAGAMVIVCTGILSANGITRAALEPVLRPWLPLIAVFLFLSMAFPAAALAALADEAQEKRRGITMGIFALAMAGGMVVGPPTVGWVRQYIGAQGVFVYVLAVLGLITLFVVLRTRARGRGA